MCCKYCKEEMCVNPECPARADYCPVPDMSGVCKFEEREVPEGFRQGVEGKLFREGK